LRSCPSSPGRWAARFATRANCARFANGWKRWPRAPKRRWRPKRPQAAAPWNYPFLTAANTIVPALLAGNAILLKHSAQTPLAGERFAEAFALAGLPDGLFANLVL